MSAWDIAGFVSCGAIVVLLVVGVVMADADERPIIIPYAAIFGFPSLAATAFCAARLLGAHL